MPKPAPDVQPPPEPEPEPGRADLDPDNDQIVGPPEPIADCTARLEASGIRFRSAELPVRNQGGVTCGAPEVVIYERGPERISYNASPLVTCGLALALARFESLLEKRALRAFGSRVTRIRQGGTYSCRKMARFTGMVSEHSYANAIDVYAFTLADGRTISVTRDFGKTDVEPTRNEARFLRELTRSAFDDGVFSVVLTPYWDALHRDHFHFDLARYRADGTR